MSSENQPKETAEQVLTQETARLLRKTKLTWAIGIPVIVLLTGYLSWVCYQWKSLVLDPTNVALLITQTIDEDAPGVIASAEHQLNAGAPEFADWINSEINYMIDEIEVNASHHVDTVFELLPVLDESSRAAVEDYFAERGPQVAEFYQSHSHEEFVEQVVDTVYDRFAEELAMRYRVYYKGKPIHGLKDISLAHLHYIHEKLRRLAKLHPARMTPSERLERRVIVAWVNALGEDLHLKLYN